MRWGVNWQLVTGERKKKSLWSFPPSSASSLLLTVKSNSFFFFFRYAEPLGGGSVSRWGRVEVWARTRPGRARSIPSEPSGSSCWKFTAPSTSHLPPSPPPFRPRLHPGYCRNYSSAPWLHSSAGSTVSALYQRGHTGEDAWSLSDENTLTHNLIWSEMLIKYLNK